MNEDVISLKGEIWKIIDNSTYAVSNFGRVKRISFNRLHNINKTYYKSKEYLLLHSTNKSKGYCRIGLILNGKQKAYSVHRLVASAFIDNPNNYSQVNHIDGNKENNHVNNLEWCNQSQNMQHRIKILKQESKLKGNNNPKSKLTEDQVKQLPKLLQIMTKAAISRLWKVNANTLSEITSGRSWKYLNLKF